MIADHSALHPRTPRPSSRRGLLPGFGLSLGYTLLYYSLLVLLPLAMLVVHALAPGWERLREVLTEPRVVASIRLTLELSAAAAAIDAAAGLLIAWTLTRHSFVGRRLLDAAIDLPFAMPTAVSGIALTTLYSSSGWFGRLLEPFGLKVAYTPLGILAALVFIGLPFVVRTLQPAIAELDIEQEEAAANLGATRGQTFRRITLPVIAPALVTGFALAFARALGEYGTVIFIAGNIPFKTEIATLLIVTRLEQHDVTGASIIGVAMLALSFVLLAAIDALQRWSARRAGMEG